jgi:molybdopterin synthase catalytic subunit
VPDLVEDPIAIEPLVAVASRPEVGAVAVFVGTTRDRHEGRVVERLLYEAYVPMALEALGRIEEETGARFDVTSCRIVHRLGEVPPTEASVVVVVAAAHRGPAFDACRWAMDQVKAGAPIWKKEHYADGSGSWVPGAKLEST